MIYFISFTLGLICSFGQPPFNYVIYSISALALFFYFLLNLNKNTSKFWFSFSFGYGYCIYSVHWFSESLLTYGDSLLWLVPFGLLLMPAFFALYFALAGYLISKYSYNNITLIALIWIALELVRSYAYIEFPWLLIGYIWSDSLVMSQIASVFGIYGLSFLTVFWVGSIMEATILIIDRKNKLHNIKLVYLAFFSFLACYIYGVIHLKAEITPQTAKILVIQPNMDQNIDLRIKNSFKNLTDSIKLSASKEEVDYIIWPEGANEFQLDNNLLNILKNAAPHNGTLIFSSSRINKSTKQHWNSLFAINSDGVVIDYYDKIHLVPLGEFIPFKLRTLLPFINKITPGGTDYSHGEFKKTINTKEPFLPSICYEAAFPEGSSQSFTWIVNLTNDGWFGSSIGPYQHLAMSKFRAIEQGTPMVRAALTGISAIIDSFGNIIKTIPLLKKGTLESTLPGYISGFTYFHIYGNLMLIILLITFLTLSFLFKKSVNLRSKNNH